MPAVAEEQVEYYSDTEIKEIEGQMREAAEKLEFETAAGLRDRIRAIRERQITLGIKKNKGQQK